MRTKAIVFSAALFHICAIASCQIVNIESARIQSDTIGWSGSGGMAVSLEKNNRSISTVAFEAHVQYKTRKDLWLILGDYGFLKGGREKFVYNSFAHVRYNRKLNKWLRWEIFSQVQSNHITNIDSRFLTGTGPRFKIVDLKKFRLYAASLVMFEREKEVTKTTAIHQDLRSSSYVSFTLLPATNIEIVNTLFYQPLIRKPEDLRLFNQALLRVKANDRFALYIKWNYLFDSFPAGTAPETTYLFISGFHIDI